MTRTAVPERWVLCRAIMGRGGLAHLWTSSGPTARALALLVDQRSALSAQQRRVLDLAWDVWRGDTVLSQDLVRRLSVVPVEAVIAARGGHRGPR